MSGGGDRRPAGAGARRGARRRNDVERQTAIVRRVIHDWNPMGLLAAGAWGDELDREIASIVRQLPRVGSEHDAVLVVSRTFTSSFAGACAFGPDGCWSVGAKLFEALASENLI